MTAKPKTNIPAPAGVDRRPAGKSTPLKPWQLDLIACAIIYLAIVVMFNQVILSGKIFTSGDDTVNALSMNKFAAREAESGEYPFWCPEMFGGFPGFAAGAYSTYEHMDAPYSLAYKWFSPRYWVDVVTMKGLFLGGDLSRDNGEPYWLVALMLYGGLLIYLLMRRLQLQVWIALFCGLVFAWNPYLISIITAAHGGKLATFIYIPLIVLLTWNVLQHRRLLDLALLAMGFGWQVAFGGHTQILLYSGFTMFFIFLVWAYSEFREGQTANIGIAAGMTGIALVLGFGIGSLWYIPLMDYVPYSIRGVGPALATTPLAGYSMEQATMWSMMPGELITFVFPSWFGLKSPLYWGGMPFTTSSFYFGAVPLLFAVLALFGKKTRLMWALILLAIFSILLSFGSYFETLYALFFNYFPTFNKFRTPSLILLLVVLVGIILSGYGIRFVLDSLGSEKWKKVFLYGAAICGGILIIALIGGESVLGLFASGVREGETARYNAQQITQIRSMRLELMQKDIALVMLWLGLAFTACWLYVSGKLKPTLLIGAVILITVIDLGLFSKQFFETQNPVSELPSMRGNKVTQFLKQDPSIYRVYPVGNLNQDNRYVAWDIESFGGFHGAKMRSWQDVQEYVIPNGELARFPLNMSYLSAMNCKYIIADRPLPLNDSRLDSVMADPAAGMILYRNPRAMERAFFVDSIIVITDRVETFRLMQDKDLQYDYHAIVNGPLPGPVGHDPNRTVKVTSHSPHEVQISAKNNLPSFLVLSDAYYEPGWEAMVDGAASKIYLVNGFMRGLYLEPGDHSIIFKYTAKYENRGVTVATLSYFLVLGLVIGGIVLVRKQRKAA